MSRYMKAIMSCHDSDTELINATISCKIKLTEIRTHEIWETFFVCDDSNASSVLPEPRI